jgi:hypothetical protein
MAMWHCDFDNDLLSATDALVGIATPHCLINNLLKSQANRLMFSTRSESRLKQEINMRMQLHVNRKYFHEAREAINTLTTMALFIDDATEITFNVDGDDIVISTAARRRRRVSVGLVRAAV